MTDFLKQFYVGHNTNLLTYSVNQKLQSSINFSNS